MRILVVEDDSTIASYIVSGLREVGFAVDCAEDGESGLDLALTELYDVAIIDIMLPKRDGLSLINEIRGRGLATPVIILSAKRTVEDRIRGLESGSDDYLTKPFSFSELLARVHALIRRNARITEPSELKVEDLYLNLITREVRRGSREIDLQPKEFALLEYLMRNAGRPVSKTMILEHVWDYNFESQTNVVDVMIWRLRNKMDRDEDGERKLIHTIRGLGYVLKKI